MRARCSNRSAPRSRSRTRRPKAISGATSCFSRPAARGLDARRADPRRASRCAGRGRNLGAAGNPARGIAPSRCRFPCVDRRCDAEDWTRLGEAISTAPAHWRREHRVSTDKNLQNWQLVGAIRAMLPARGLIECRRDPVRGALERMEAPVCERSAVHLRPRRACLVLARFRSAHAFVARALSGRDRAPRLRSAARRTRSAHPSTARRRGSRFRSGVPSLPRNRARRGYRERGPRCARRSRSTPHARSATARCSIRCARRSRARRPDRVPHE